MLVDFVLALANSVPDDGLTRSVGTTAKGRKSCAREFEAMIGLAMAVAVAVAVVASVALMMASVRFLRTHT